MLAGLASGLCVEHHSYRGCVWSFNYTLCGSYSTIPSRYKLGNTCNPRLCALGAEVFSICMWQIVDHCVQPRPVTTVASLKNQQQHVGMPVLLGPGRVMAVQLVIFSVVPRDGTLISVLWGCGLLRRRGTSIQNNRTPGQRYIPFFCTPRDMTTRSAWLQAMFFGCGALWCMCMPNGRALHGQEVR
jgi:hypothetical protein